MLKLLQKLFREKPLRLRAYPGWDLHQAFPLEVWCLVRTKRKKTEWVFVRIRNEADQYRSTADCVN